MSVAVDSTGTVGAMCSLDSNIAMWRIGDNSFHAAARQPPSEAWGVAFVPRPSPDAPLLLAIAGGSANCVRLWDVGAGAQVAAAAMPPNEDKGADGGGAAAREKFVLSVAVSADGRRLAAGAMDGAVAIFDLAAPGTLTLAATLRGHFKPVRGLAFTPDGRHLLTACDDCHVGVFDVAGGALVDSLSGHENWVLSVAVHPDGTAAVTGGADGTVRVWDLATRSCAQVLGDHGDQVWGVAWRGDGARVASVSDDRSLAVWDFA